MAPRCGPIGSVVVFSWFDIQKRVCEKSHTLSSYLNKILNRSISPKDPSKPYHVLLRLLPSHEQYHGLRQGCSSLHILQGRICLRLLRTRSLHAKQGSLWLSGAKDLVYEILSGSRRGQCLHRDKQHFRTTYIY